MKTRLKKLALLSIMGVCTLTGILYIYSSTNAKTAERKSSLIKLNSAAVDDHAGRTFSEEDISGNVSYDGIYQETPQENYTSTNHTNSSFENNVMEDEVRGSFQEEEISGIISKDGTYEDIPKVN